MIVVMVPINDGKFLMVYNPKRGWEFPGGKVEYGESPKESVLRECREEAGIVLEKVEVIEENEYMTVFKGIIKEILGGEMKWSLFSKLPEDIAFSREEALHFLKLVGIYK